MKQLLLLHGALGAKDQLEGLKGMLSGDYDAHTMNFTGHGGEEIPNEPFTMDMFAGDIIAYLDKMNLNNINIFGYSMGGYAALHAAIKYPDRIGNIFTLATKFEWSPEIAEREVKMLDAARIAEKVPKFAAELAKRHGEGNWVNLLEKTAEMMRSLGTGEPLKLDRVNSEVMISLGDRDKMVSIEETVSAYRSIANAKLAIFPGTPHPIEQADKSRLSEEIRRFFV